jgi:hypothetical protein
MSGDPTDSIFTWVFRALGGDSWGGTLVEDSTRFAVGDTIVTPHGTYSIILEQEKGIDLSPAGLAEGMVFVDFYWDAATAQFLVTRAGPATAVGFAGLGSELDAAWTGTGWDDFGRSGQSQANSSDGPDSTFTWLFVGASGGGGDSLWGTLHEDSDAFAPGDTIAGAQGTYRILTETPFGFDTGLAEGTVTTTRYRDAASGVDLPLESGGAYPTGLAGLGSEVDRALNAGAWVEVGRGGRSTTNRAPDASFTWVFEANGGDSWSGFMVGHAPAYAPGDTIAGAAGRYRILGEQAWTGDPGLDRNVWVVTYQDAGSGRSFTPRAWDEGRVAGTAGLGSEHDAIWNDAAWDDFGRGGTAQADAYQSALFTFVFEADSGDRWIGWLAANATSYALGDIVSTAHGRYRIDGEYAWSAPPSFAGSVWVLGYFDAQSGVGLTTRAWVEGRVAGTAGLGSELDTAWNGLEWESFGQGGALQADLYKSTLFTWVFEADTGDHWIGWLAGDASAYAANDIIRTAHGRYVITGEYSWTGAASFNGSVWVLSYFDAQSGFQLTARAWNEGRFAGTAGLGSESDTVFNGLEWVSYGQGGARQANLYQSTLFTWTFEANSGDRWIGWLAGDAAAHAANDIIPTAHGRYVITGEYPWTGSASLNGSVWVLSYFDAQSGFALTARAWNEGRFAGTAGLGSELDTVWNGQAWDDYGLGGAAQANLYQSTLFTWVFEANTGDRWTGWLAGDASAYAPGDLIATAHGRYRIQTEAPWSGSASLANSVWVYNYFDAQSGLNLLPLAWQQGRSAGTAGLGSEYDSVWNGLALDDFGRGGAAQADMRGVNPAPDGLLG